MMSPLTSKTISRESACGELLLAVPLWVSGVHGLPSARLALQRKSRPLKSLAPIELGNVFPGGTVGWRSPPT
jgi:hypothetical protein